MDLVDGRLVLIKRVLQAIPINWTTLASITIHTVSNSTSPQITVEVNQRSKGYGFRYLGNLGLIKGYWRLGMKHPNTLAKALVAIGTRKLINRKGLWQEILLQKYIAPASLEETTKTMEETSTRIKLLEGSLAINIYSHIPSLLENRKQLYNGGQWGDNTRNSSNSS